MGARGEGNIEKTVGLGVDYVCERRDVKEKLSG